MSSWYTPNKKTQKAESDLNDAKAYRNSIGSYDDNGRQQQISDTLKKLENRKFDYDANSDPLAKSYTDQYQRNGRLAAMDTMAKANAATGGYGSSYSQSVSQQAYNNYLSELNNKLLDLQNNAYSRFQDEGNNMRANLATLQDIDNTAYSRYRDKISDADNDIDRQINLYNMLYNQDYGAVTDERNFNYTKEQDSIANALARAQFEEQKKQNAISNAYNEKQLAKTTSYYDKALNSVSEFINAGVDDEKIGNYIERLYDAKKITQEEGLALLSLVEDKTTTYPKHFSAFGTGR